MGLDLLQSLAFGFRQEKRGRDEINDGATGEKKNMVEYPYLPTVGKKTAAIVVETA